MIQLAILFAGVAQDQQAARPRVPPRDVEVKMALSAAPEHLRDQAGVYALGPQGYELMRASGNGFTCIVNRDHPLSLKPTCFDAEGSQVIIPKILRIGELLMQGRSAEEIRKDIAQGFNSGRFIAPRRTGVAYMLSQDNRPFNAATGATGRFPPHIMFYAPDLTNADLGFSSQAFGKNRHLPFIGYQGKHGYIIVITGELTGQ